MKPTFTSFFLPAAVLIVIACSSKNLVVLVPDPDGVVGAVTVVNAAGSVEISKPNQATVIKDEATAPGAPLDMDRKEIQTLFSAALAAQPLPPVHFLLYFEIGSTRLTPESADHLADILAAIRARASTSVGVVGHSDTLGESADNHRLSLQRAAAVSALLVQNGVPASHIESTSHGEENLLIKTGDDVAEPRNRRVEVVVR
jgi:outer membrane protein OmpA-like peptidoglycan-associated protein